MKLNRHNQFIIQSKSYLYIIYGNRFLYVSCKHHPNGSFSDKYTKKQACMKSGYS